jgi:hypothetical protein
VKLPNVIVLSCMEGMSSPLNTPLQDHVVKGIVTRMLETMFFNYLTCDSNGSGARVQLTR